jgi:hypothetical protein
VMILVLVTYHFGDEAGQGFVHGFAGMVLFMVALAFMLLADKLLGLFIPAQRLRPASVTLATGNPVDAGAVRGSSEPAKFSDRKMDPSIRQDGP